MNLSSWLFSLKLLLEFTGLSQLPILEGQNIRSSLASSLQSFWIFWERVTLFMISLFTIYLQLERKFIMVRFIPSQSLQEFFFIYSESCRPISVFGQKFIRCRQLELSRERRFWVTWDQSRAQFLERMESAQLSKPQGRLDQPLSEGWQRLEVGREKDFLSLSLISFALCRLLVNLCTDLVLSTSTEPFLLLGDDASDALLGSCLSIYLDLNIFWLTQEQYPLSSLCLSSSTLLCFSFLPSRLASLFFCWISASISLRMMFFSCSRRSMISDWSILYRYSEILLARDSREVDDSLAQFKISYAMDSQFLLILSCFSVYQSSYASLHSSSMMFLLISSGQLMKNLAISYLKNYILPTLLSSSSVREDSQERSEPSLSSDSNFCLLEGIQCLVPITFDLVFSYMPISIIAIQKMNSKWEYY